MSELSYLEKLLDGVEVEWKTLEDITLRTSNIKWREVIRSYRYIDLTSVDIATKKITETTEITKNNAPSRAQKLVDENDVIFATTRPTQQRFCLIDSEYAGEVASTGYCILRAKQDQVLPKWILHWISTSDFKKHVEENQSGSAYPAISDSKVKECLIPIPCPDNPEKSLAIQSEIVRILDKFTALTAELTAELNMRKKQYNYYRDQLLSFDNEDVPHLPMGQKDIGEFIRGGTFQKKDFMDAGVGCIHYGQIYTYYGTYAKKTKTHISATLAKKCKKAQKGNLIIATTSENDEDVCKAVAWLGSEDIAVSSDACIYKHNLNPKYVSYFFQTEQFQNQKRQYITGAKVRRVNADNLSKILIPVPSMEIQERIVSILDKFDTLTNSITEGLPREIALRQKQYEYYRDLLFSFPKPETVSN
ncbi:TPA: restriction endonuclease subunit S [Escherichia coli]|uniref:restriction endonuclease subunit S n=1 Tax=Escherichia coli TaxID=562 RepID=UPI000FB14A09|nr:restriction endonuclease subunit S [Escherichia coli]EFE9556124.1 restriction endonuclease subunit S [Escherichia coli]EFF6048985.1 restriction endonuclease subunit S [Escherichia coli]EFH8722412.1 restriction endonuclease subunit S [Escherichia coli]EGM7441900.1 restriction endonuclease subunit S [Escherichia coli]EHC4299421.1 restriction endonuclease subunit S [Escherichia coli]